jgi:epoxyqueuosine reductase
MSAHTVTVGKIDTPLGPFGAVFTPKGLARLTFAHEPYEECEMWVRRWEPEAATAGHDPRLDDLARQLNDYFAGRLHDFDVPLDMRGTPFQLIVWDALLDVAYGETRTYSQVAAAIGRPDAVRAVGTANGANPVPIIVPCHRIIGSNGRLVGYGGGLDLKRRLLEVEGVMAPLVPLAV